MQRAKLHLDTLDTLVINHIDAPHKPEAEAIVHTFYRFVEERSDEYKLIISPVLDLEVRNCPVDIRKSFDKTFFVFINRAADLRGTS